MVQIVSARAACWSQRLEQGGTLSQMPPKGQKDSDIKDVGRAESGAWPSSGMVRGGSPSLPWSISHSQLCTLAS